MLLDDYSGPAIYLLRPRTTTDSYGDTVVTWEDPAQIRLLGASSQPLTSVEEDGVTKFILKDTRNLFFRSKYQIKATDRVLVGTEQWRVDGDPEIRDPLSGEPFGVARIIRVSGKAGA